MSPADRLPPVPPASGPSSGKPDQEPYLYPKKEPEFEPDAEPPFATMPEVSERELQADTLAFEQVGRRKPRSWGWAKLAAVLVVLGGGGAFAWQQWGGDLLGSSDDEIPTVRAADSPFKVRPESPGGVEIPNRDKLVYDRLEGDGPDEPKKGRTESLLPPPETPLPPPVAAEPASVAEESSPQITEEPGGEGEENETEMVEAKPDGAVAVAPAPIVPPKEAAPSPEQVRAAEKPVPPPSPAVKSDSQVAAAPAASIGPKAFRIQLGAVRSEAGARGEWDKLRKAHAAILGRLALNVQRADLGPKGVYYRIQAGPFADRAAADSACQALKKQKVPCLPVRPES